MIETLLLSKLMFAVICFLRFNFVRSDELRLFDNSGQIEFAKILEFKINFNEFASLTNNFFVNYSFLTIRVNVTTVTECNKKSQTCSQPIRLYGKLNNVPKPEDLYFDKKDDVGRFDGKSVLYGFEYSPCLLNKNDTLFVKMVGVEGKSNYSLSVNFNYLDNNKVLCTKPINGKNEEPPIASYYGAVLTHLGTVRYGGKLSNKNMTDDLFILKGNENNLTWEKVIINSKVRPTARYGHYMAYYDSFIIIFGGSNFQDEPLNDLWILDLDNFNWLEINYSNTKNVPNKKFLPSGEILNNHGSIIIFGGKNNLEDKNLYFLNLKILKEIIDHKIFEKQNMNMNLKNVYSYDDEFNYANKVDQLWIKIEVTELNPRYALTITQIEDNKVMFFGGFDRNDYPSSKLEILDLNDFSINVIETTDSSQSPVARGFHRIIRYGNILILYGGKIGTGENLNDMWKFIISTHKWILVKEKKAKETDFHLYKSGYIITRVENSERPVIYGGENRNKEQTNLIILLDLEICSSDVKILTDYNCIPCTEGFALSRDKKCVGCEKGSYLKIDTKYYADSKCEKCSAGSYNDKFYQNDKSSCKICEYGEFNDDIGQNLCQKCPKGKICLPGTKNPIEDTFLIDKVKGNYQIDTNYPDFLDRNNEIKLISRTYGLIVVGAITGTMILILLICYRIRKTKLTIFLISMDFLPLTGGSIRKCSGGLITLIYSILIISLSISYVIRYYYFNELIEVIPIAKSHNEQELLKSSLELDVQLIGNNFQCLDLDEKITNNTYKCHKDIEITKLNQKDYFLNHIKSLSCSVTKEGFCKVSFKCENCKSVLNGDVLQINIKNPEAFIQLYHWTLNSIWSNDFDITKGFSKIDGIFKPDKNIKSSYVFKGSEAPSLIQIFLTPIFFFNHNENINMSGFRASLNQYTRGSVRNELNFYKSDNGVKLNIEFSYSTNSFQINSKKHIEFLDFYAFILGMLAGFSFLSRIIKFSCEKCRLFDKSSEDYVELEEEQNKENERKEKLEDNITKQRIELTSKTSSKEGHFVNSADALKV